MAKKINPTSDTWRFIKQELTERRDELLSELSQLDTDTKRTDQIRGALYEISLILDLPESPSLGIPGDD